MFVEGRPSMGGPESNFVPPRSVKVKKTYHSLGKFQKQEHL